MRFGGTLWDAGIKPRSASCKASALSTELSLHLRSAVSLAPFGGCFYGGLASGPTHDFQVIFGLVVGSQVGPTVLGPAGVGLTRLLLCPGQFCGPGASLTWCLLLGLGAGGIISGFFLGFSFPSPHYLFLCASFLPGFLPGCLQPVVEICWRGWGGGRKSSSSAWWSGDATWGPAVRPHPPRSLPAMLSAVSLLCAPIGGPLVSGSLPLLRFRPPGMCGVWSLHPPKLPCTLGAWLTLPL